LNFFVKLPEKIEIFRKCAWKNQNLLDLDPPLPQISSPIDGAADRAFCTVVLCLDSHPRMWIPYFYSKCSYTSVFV